MKNKITYASPKGEAFICCLLFLFTSCSDRSTTSNTPPPGIYVSSEASPSGDGSFLSPDHSIQKAINKARPGDIIFLRGGTYYEKLRFKKSGNKQQGPITLTAYKNEKVILDGQYLKQKSGHNQLIQIENASFITIKNLTLQNVKAKRLQDSAAAILVRGHSEDIEISDNEILNIEAYYSETQAGVANAIAVYGTNPENAISNINITNNHLHHLKLGHSEALTVNGNVDGFQIVENQIHDADNIGIDIIGHEGTSSDENSDQARNGVVAKNTVHAITSWGNPAYGKSSSAGCIYIDGGKDIIVEDNTVYDCDIGIEVASEHANKSVSNITVRNNSIYSNRMTGIALGGYDNQRGKTTNCLFESNRLYNNNTNNGGNGEIFFQYYAQENRFLSNIIVASGPGVLVYTTDSASNKDNTFEKNIFWSNAEQSLFKWKNKTYKNFSDFQNAIDDDGSTYKNPGSFNTQMGRFETAIP